MNQLTDEQILAAIKAAPQVPCKQFGRYSEQCISDARAVIAADRQLNQGDAAMSVVAHLDLARQGDGCRNVVFVPGTLMDIDNKPLVLLSDAQAAIAQEKRS